MGDQLKITGVWTSNDWAQLADHGWVYGPEIQTNLRPPKTAYNRGPSYVVTQEITPDYDDWAYLPNYGYDTYWYGGAPVFFYNIAVWYRFHPWWRHHGYQAWWWQGGHHGRRAWDPKAFGAFARTGRGGNAFMNGSNVSAFSRSGTVRGFRVNRSNISSSNVTRLNVNRFNSGSTNAFRSRTFSSANTLRFGSANVFHSRNFATPHTFRSGGFSGGHFSGMSRSGSFSMGGGRGRHR